MHLPKRFCVVFVTLAGACATARYAPVPAQPRAAESLTAEPLATEPVAAKPPATEPLAAEPLTIEPLTTDPLAAEPASLWQFAQNKPPPSELAPPPAAAQAPPAAAAKGPRPTRIFADMTFAAGTYEHNTRADGGVRSGDTDGGFLRMRGEYIFDQGIGAGLALEGYASDDDLFGNTGTLNIRGRTGDAFLFFVAQPSELESFRLPLRVGPYFHSTVLDDDVTSLKTTWGGAGLRVEIEPEVWFVRRDRFSFGLYGDAAVGAHATRVVLRGGGGNTHFEGDGATLGAEVGVQAIWARHVTTRLGYLYRANREDESEVKNGLAVSGVTTTFSGLLVSVGVRF